MLVNESLKFENRIMIPISIYEYPSADKREIDRNDDAPFPGHHDHASMRAAFSGC